MKNITSIFKYRSKKKRQKDLEKFLKEYINRKDIFSTKEMKNFLDLESNCPHLTNIIPTEEGKLETISLGV